MPGQKATLHSNRQPQKVCLCTGVSGVCIFFDKSGLWWLRSSRSSCTLVAGPFWLSRAVTRLSGRAVRTHIPFPLSHSLSNTPPWLSRSTRCSTGYFFLSFDAFSRAADRSSCALLLAAASSSACSCFCFSRCCLISMPLSVVAHYRSRRSLSIPDHCPSVTTAPPPAEAFSMSPLDPGTPSPPVLPHPSLVVLLQGVPDPSMCHR